MKNWFKRNMVNILIACVIGVPISLYGISQQPRHTVVSSQEIIEYQKTPETDLEVSIEPLEFYDIPLSEELQTHIFKECEKHNIAPVIVIAIIERESSYKADVIGDNGESFGLMQIYAKHHQERMDRLSCTNLLDPFQNITVGIDYLAELKDEETDLYWVLMAYNGGRAYSNENIEKFVFSEYAIEVSKRASKLEQVMYGD